MSYQVLARKWRPSRFQEMVGQEHVLKALVNALDDNRLHHAYLFTGTRGVGKTSIARLFAKSLNCETGVSSTPCGECSACREIAEGRFVDLIEVDAASRTKVEDTRELLENVQYAPTHGRYKVYLIDEVHMLSSHSFNALLKTLEEPPPHVKFLLATTDPQKLPVTILSRCLQFNLKNLIPERIVSHLKFVLGEEQIAYEEPALWMLARSADGSMRDAMSLTDQAIAFGAGTITDTDVRAMLGTIDQQQVYCIIEALSQGNPRGLLQAVAELAEFSPDYSALLGDLLSILHRIAICQTLPDAIDNSLGDEERIRQLAAAMSAEDVQLYYQTALIGRRDLPFVPDGREGLEMVLLRMLAFRPSGASARPVSLQQESVAPAAVETAPPAATEYVAPASAPPDYDYELPPEPVVTMAPAQPVGEVAAVKKSPAEIKVDNDPPPWDIAEEPLSEPPPVAAAPVEQPSPAEPESAATVVITETVNAAAPVSLDNLSPSGWVALQSVLGLSGMTESLASHLSLEIASAEQLVFHYQPEQSAMLNETQQQRIRDSLQDYFRSPVAVEFRQASQTRETPAQYQSRKREERQLQALQSLRQDPTVQRIQQVFDAQIDLTSVTPIDPN